MAVTSRPTLKKTSLNLGKNFGAKGNLGNVSGHDTSVSSASHIKSIQSQRRVLGRVIETEGDVSELSVRAKNLEVTNDALISQNRQFQVSIASIQQRVGALESGQKAILEFQKDRDKIEKRQRKLEEQRLKREAASASLEDGQDKKDIEDKDPKTKKAATGAMGILDRLKRFFTFVVAGWFTDKTFKLIEAFQSGNQKEIRKIGLKLLAGAAAVGSIMLLAAGAIGPVLAGIGSLIGVLAGLLFNPVTLTALLIAVGIGGAIMGIRALWKWGRNKATGGQKFTDRHKELDQKLKDAGMNARGISDSRSAQDKRHSKHGRSEEQERIFQEVQAERDKLHATKNAMNDEIKEARKQWKAEAMANKPEGGKVDWKTENAKWKEQKAAIQKKHTDTITSSAGNGQNVSSNTNAADVTSKIGPEPDNEGNITVVPMPKEQETPTSSTGTASSVEYIATSNTTNMYVLNSKVQYNTTG